MLLIGNLSLIFYFQAPMNGNATFMVGGDEEVPPMVDQKSLKSANKMKVKSLTCMIPIVIQTFPPNLDT